MTKQTDKPLINPSPTAAVWSEWSEWSNCTKCSNFEFSYRTRECKIPLTSKRIISSLKNECFGNNKEVSKCKNCPDANTTNYFDILETRAAQTLFCLTKLFFQCQ